MPRTSATTGRAEALYIIDQTLLPGEEKEIRLQTIDEMVEAIRALRVRGAPAIGHLRRLLHVWCWPSPSGPRTVPRF